MVVPLVRAAIFLCILHQGRIFLIEGVDWKYAMALDLLRHWQIVVDYPYLQPCHSREDSFWSVLLIVFDQSAGLWWEMTPQSFYNVNASIVPLWVVSWPHRQLGIRLFSLFGVQIALYCWLVQVNDVFPRIHTPNFQESKKLYAAKIHAMQVPIYTYEQISSCS